MLSTAQALFCTSMYQQDYTEQDQSSRLAMRPVQTEEQPPWATWDACRVLTAKEDSLAPAHAATIQLSVHEETISNFCQFQNVTRAAIIKLACCIAIGAYAGVEDACLGVRADGAQSVLCCHLDPEQSVARLFEQLQEVDLTDLGFFGSLVDLLDSAGLFDTILVINGQSPGFEWTGPATRQGNEPTSIESSNVSRVKA